MIRCLTASLLVLILTARLSAQDHGAGWQPLAVPGAWEDNARDKLANYDGFAWYRCWVKIPAAWRLTDLSLAIEKVQNAHEAYWNGVRVGGVGSFPPGFRDATAEPLTGGIVTIYTATKRL